MQILCNDCRHNKVCQYMNHYKDTLDSIKCKVSTPFELKLNCPYYETRIENWYGYGSLNSNATANALNGSVVAVDCPEAHYGDHRADQSL